MQRTALWLRWSGRDLRRRWLVVAALALVIAIGTGAAAAFGSLSQWRRLSNDASFAALGMHDLQVTFSAQPVAADRALAAVRGVEHPQALRAVRAGLDLPTQVEVTTEGRAAVLPGRLVGVDTGAPGAVDRVLPVRGGPLSRAPAGTAVVEVAFAERYRLPTAGTVRIAGGAEVRYVGWGRSAEYLLNGEGAWLGEPSRAVLFLPLADAQRLAGVPGTVNRIAVALAPGADPARAHREIVDALRAALPDAPAVVADRADDPTYRMLYKDIDGDQKLWNVVALLVLGGAAIATFNLANRVAAAQRREIGVGAALGLPTPALAIRPLLFGVQVALLGTAAGIGVGALLGWWLGDIMGDLLPLPEWRAPFQPGQFGKAAVLGFGIPLLGVGWPVWRAVRVAPAEAIRTAQVAARTGRVSRALRGLPLPGRSIGHLPVRHLLRAPGRTALTAAGIGASITVLVAMFGMLDSFTSTMDDAERELVRGAPGRTVVGLDTFHPVDDGTLAAIGALPEVARAEPGLRVTGRARAGVPGAARTGGAARTAGGGKSVDLVVDVLDFRSAMWRPTLRRATAPGVPAGIVLSEKAAADLGVRPGGTVRVEHARRTPAAAGDGFETVTSEFVVAAVHPHPMRALAYLDAGSVGVFGLAGATNLVQVRPAPGVDEAGLRRALLGYRAVGSVQPVTAAGRELRDSMAEFVDVFRMLEGFVLLLALLIAFNAATISADERTREHATVFAFGLGIRTVLRNATVESVLVGVLGTAFGLLLGAVTVWWMVGDLLAGTLPDLAVAPSLSPGTVLKTLAVGIAAVAAAPLLTVRRLWRTDIPTALRVVE